MVLNREFWKPHSLIGIILMTLGLAIVFFVLGMLR